MFWKLLVFYIYLQIAVSTKGERRDVICQGSDFQASCSTGQVLVFHSANYGRTDLRACPSTSAASATVAVNTSCVQPNTLSLLNQRCFGKEECLFEMDAGTFGDPCPGTEKYLEVEFKCVPEKEITEMCTRYKITLESNPSGYIKSPNYPDPYGPDKDCVVLLRANQGFRYDVTLLDLDMENRDGMKGCYDWLIVKDNTDNVDTNNYCGRLDNIHTGKPQKVLQLKEVIVSFTSDGVAERNGFLLRYEEVLEKPFAKHPEL